VALVALTLCLLAAGREARADDLLVMPYACTMAGGQPVLTRGPEQSHRIIGARNERKFTACSPVNPDMCRTWTVHRFDLDCDGARVPWVSVVAATNEGSRRAWLLDGRLVLRMGPLWSLAPDDPCAREGRPEEGFGYRRMRRLCADRLAGAPPPVVEMPFGYAPMLGVDGFFVKATPGIGAAPPPLPPVVAGPPARATGAEPPSQQSTAAEAQPPRPAPAREPVSREPVLREPPAAPSAAPPKVPPQLSQPASPAASEGPKAPNLGPRPAEIPSPTPKVAANAPPSPSVAAAHQVPPATVGATPPGSEAQKAAPAAPATVAPEPAPAPRSAASPSPPKPVQKQIEEQAPPPKQADEPKGGASGLSLLGALRTTTVGAIVAFAGLAVGLLTAFALARRSEHAHHASRRRRDLAAVSLDAKRGKPQARIGDARGHLPPNAAGSAMGREPGRRAAAGAAAELGDRMPSTRSEAYQVLGIGVAPSASEAAIKKVVDALRVTWHPDHAKDEADRALRELRSKQINAAWELLRGQRAEV
jgi:hypothetical protein